MRPSALGRVYILVAPIVVCASAMGQPYQATGVKVGEVTATSAIVWTRLTLEPEARWDGIPPPDAQWDEPQVPEGKTVGDLEGAAPGCEGQVRVAYRAAREGARERSTPWAAVDAERDFTRQIALRELRANMEYLFRVESQGEEGAGQSVEGRFRTAPTPRQVERVVFTVVTGQCYWTKDGPDGQRIYRAMQELAPSFFVHTGDIVYYDRARPIAQSAALARLHWQRLYSLPLQREFHRVVPSYFMKDDHDTLWDDCWPTMEQPRTREFTFVQGQAIFREQVPMGDRTYRTVRWGKDLQVWMVEGRDFRSPNPMVDGPEKSIWGAEQKAWLKRTILESDAAFKLLISPTPIVGPDRESKRDNHSNSNWGHEGNEIRRWIRDEAPEVIVICGDRHWQYVSVDPETDVREFSCGPTTNQHAGGFNERVPEYHRYFSVTGGFLSGTVERVEGRPTLVLRHHDVEGEVLNEERISPAEG